MAVFASVGTVSLDLRCGITAELELGRCADCGQLLIRQTVRVDLDPYGGMAIREEDIVTVEAEWHRVADLAALTDSSTGAASHAAWPGLVKGAPSQ